MEKMSLELGLKCVDFFFLFFFQKASQSFRNSAYQTRIRFSKF